MNAFRIKAFAVFCFQDRGVSCCVLWNCGSVWFRRWLQRFRTNTLLPISGYKIHEVGFFETLVDHVLS